MTDGGLDWTVTVRAHNQRVVVSLLALGLTFDTAEEVAQETWARLLSKHQAGNLPTVEMPGLAIAQARFLALDVLRRRRVRPAREAQGHAEIVGDDEVSPVDLPAASEERAMAREVLDAALERISRLSTNARIIFLRITEDPPKKHAEIAAELGISVQRVRQIVCETRQKLRPLSASTGDA